MFLQNLIKKQKKPADIVIVGLGNAGKEYKNTPHNIGFELIDAFVDLLKERGKDIQEHHTKQCAVYETTLKSKRIIFVKPLLYMNRSGVVLKHILQQYELPTLENLWVVHDEIDLPLALLRISFDSQSAGNKGVQDIINNLDSKQFYRFRIGVRPQKAFDTEEYVMQKLEKHEVERLEKCIKQCIVTLVESIQTNPKQAKQTLESK